MRTQNQAKSRQARLDRRSRRNVEYVMSVSGHRPDRLGGYNQETYSAVNDFALYHLRSIRPSRLIVGMAQGFDMSCAQACLSLGIKYIAAVPFRGWNESWTVDTTKIYRDLLRGAEKVVYVSQPPYTASKMHARNRWMIDRSEAVLCLWDGKPYGGTYATKVYAEKQNKTVIDLWYQWEDFTKERRS